MSDDPRRSGSETRRVIGRLPHMDVKIVRDDLPHGRLGCWDERTGDIVISNAVTTKAGTTIIVAHEAMHMAESVLKQEGIIKRRMPEKFIENAAYAVSMALAHAGLLRISGQTFEAFARARGEAS